MSSSALRTSGVSFSASKVRFGSGASGSEDFSGESAFILAVWRRFGGARQRVQCGAYLALRRRDVMRVALEHLAERGARRREVSACALERATRFIVEQVDASIPLVKP